MAFTLILQCHFTRDFVVKDFGNEKLTLPVKHCILISLSMQNNFIQACKRFRYYSFVQYITRFMNPLSIHKRQKVITHTSLRMNYNFR